MKMLQKSVPINKLGAELKISLSADNQRLGLLSSIDGDQLISLILQPATGQTELWTSPLDKSSYNSLTAVLPQVHWFERVNWDMFGILPENHPRLKPVLLHEPYAKDFFPLRTTETPHSSTFRTPEQYQFLQVRGEGVYEIPVGPIHASVIEPGHFRFSCLGESIVNLELQLGWLHRGVEKRITEVPWQKARFVAESAASDTAIGNSLAHAIAIESLFDVEVTPAANSMRTLALEIERAAMHIIDIGGAAHDLGFLGISSSMSRLRGKALALGQALTGTRIQRFYVIPGGVRNDSRGEYPEINKAVRILYEELKPVIAMFEENQSASERMEVGRISRSLAQDFGMVGIIARACGLPYDARQHFKHGNFPELAPPVSVETSGDILGRTRVRIAELWRSLDLIETETREIPGGETNIILPDALPADAIGVAIVEAFRGELIHLLFTDSNGNIKRYAIKDPSFTNWTAISVAIRNNLIADFPLCNKSMALSYSGNDL
jgi:Ni,Fe-hydrogenase III large subunit